MMTTVEGIYKNGRVEITEALPTAKEGRVLVTFLPTEESTPATPSQMTWFGMFSGPRETTEEDFKIAEFHGDSDDGLDWS